MQQSDRLNKQVRVQFLQLNIKCRLLKSQRLNITTTTMICLDQTKLAATSLNTSSNCKTSIVQDNLEFNEPNYYTLSEAKHTIFGVNRVLKVIFSTPGLVLLVVAYSVMGALIFPLLEVPQTLRQSMEIAKSREDCLRELWAITEKLNVLYERNWTMLVHEQLRQFEGTIVSASRKVAMDNNIISTTRAGYTIIRSNMNNEEMGWSFNEALLYSLTVITTIGHGSLTPKTAAGKIATILYALIGVPLMLMCLSSLGILLADALQCTYAKLCCQLTRHHHATPDDTSEVAIKLEEGKYQRGCSVNDQLAAATSGCQLISDDMQRDSNQSVASAGCKYDGISSAVNSHNDCKLCNRGTIIADGNNGSKQNAMQYKLYLNSTTNNAVVDQPAAQTVAQTQFFNIPQQQQQSSSSVEMKSDIMLMPEKSPLITTTTTIRPATETTTMTTYTFSNEGMEGGMPVHYHFGHPLQTIRIAVSQATNPVNGSNNNNASTMPPFLDMPNTMMRLQSPQQSQQQQHHLIATTNNCHYVLPAPPTISQTGKWGSVTAQPPQPTTNIYFPITAESLSSTLPSTLPRQSSYSQTFNRYEQQSLKPQATKAIESQTPDKAFPIVTTTSVIGLRRANILTNPLAAEHSSLRKMCVINKFPNAIDAIHNNKYFSSSSQPPAQHAIDCKATAIMEDEEENEQRRLGNCPHGTPSRVPLIRDAHEMPTIKGKSGIMGVTFHRPSYGNNCQNSSTYHKNQQKSQQCVSHRQRHKHKRNYCSYGIEGSDDEHNYNDYENDDDDNDDDADGDNECVHNSGCYMLKCRNGGSDRSTNEQHITYSNNNDEDVEHADKVNSPQIPISVVLALLTGYICLGAGMFAMWEENWSLIDGAYFCFVTLTTIGYGDFVPEHVLSTADVHFFTFCAYLVIGLILVAMALSIFETQLLWKCRRIAVRLKLIN